MRIAYLFGFLLVLTACTTRTVEVAIPVQEAPSPTESTSSVEDSQREFEIPSSVQLDVPFTSQAPFADWNPPFDEACEEASAIIVHHYLSGEPLTPEIADAEIRALAQWEEDNGYAIDITTEQLAEVIRTYYGYNTRVSETVTTDSILYELSQGNPVIVPLAGQDIGNPYYSGDGPPYHMLVITGYTRTRFITNDPGTKRGEGYTYPFDTIINAVHDWNGSTETIRQGKKVMLVITDAKVLE